MRPAKTQISRDIRPVKPESLLWAQWVAKDPRFLHADSEDSDQTGRMPRLIWVFSGRTGHFVGFVLQRLKYDQRISYVSNELNWTDGKLDKVLYHPILTVMSLSFRTDRPGQTVQTQIRLLLEEQSDQGLHCLPFRLHRLDLVLYDSHIVQILEWLQEIFWVSEYLGNLW